MFYVRLNKLRIRKNGDFIGKGEIQFMSFINHSDDSLPNLDEFITSNDVARKKEIVKTAVEQVVSSRILMQIDKVKNKSEITFGDTGYIVYKSNEIPKDFTWQLLGIENDAKYRDNATLLSNLLTDKNVTTITDGLSKILNAGNPLNGAVVELSTLVIKSIINLAKVNKDDQIGYFLASFIQPLDYPNGIRDGIKVSDLTGNMHVDYSLFGFDKTATK
jgi:hypothetical protein